MTDEQPITQIAFCPHCGNTSVQTSLLTQRFMSAFYEVGSGAKSLEPSTYLVARCETCHEIVLYLEHDAYAEHTETRFGDVVFPKPSAFNDSVPEKVRHFYQEAVTVRNASPTAFVILARRVLEEICVDRGISEGNLASNLAKLASTGVIPGTLGEASTLIRLVGNAGAHASGLNITPPQVWAVDDFVKAVIEYIYVAPEKINEFKRRYSEMIK